MKLNIVFPICFMGFMFPSVAVPLPESLSYDGYKKCLDMLEGGNRFLSKSSCENIKDIVDINRKEIRFMKTLCSKGQATYHIDGDPYIIAKDDMIWSKSGHFYDCETQETGVFDPSLKF